MCFVQRYPKLKGQNFCSYKKNCKFEPLIHKLGRIKRMVKDTGELMDAVTKYAESCKTKDGDSDADKTGQGKKNGGKGKHNGNQNKKNKRWLD